MYLHRRTSNASLIFGAGVIAALGVPAPALAFRTAADLPGFEGAGRVRWAEDSVRYEISQFLGPDLHAAEVELAVAVSFQAWTDVECAVVEATFDGWSPAVAVPGDGVVTLQWIFDGWTARGLDPTAAATTEVLYELDAAGRWIMVDADIFLNGEWFTWAIDPTEGGIARDVQAVVTHEIGHVFGMLHPCETDGRDGAPLCGPEHDGLAMHPIYDPGQRFLAADDEAGICFLYPPIECRTAGCPTGMACTFEGCGAACEEAVCSQGDRCGPLGCTSDPCAPGSCEKGCEATCDGSGAADGDPCANDLACLSGHCSVGGYCAGTCEGGGACPSGFVCDGSADPRECVATAGVFGDPCDQASDCVTGLCLLGAERGPICTRACPGDDAICPGLHVCEAVVGQLVCAPPPPVDGCGVMVGGRRGTSHREERGGAALALVVVASLAVLGRRERKS